MRLYLWYIGMFRGSRFKVSKVVVVGKKKVEVSRAAPYAYLGTVGTLATACLSSYSQSARYNQRPS